MTPKLKLRKIFVYTTFLFFLGGCADGGGGSSGSDFSVVPKGDGTALAER